MQNPPLGWSCAAQKPVSGTSSKWLESEDPVGLRKASQKENDCGKPSAAVHLRRPQRPKGATAASGETAGWAEGRYLYSAWTTSTSASRTMLTGCGARRLAQIQ